MTWQQEGYQRGMVVVAHPDDAEWGCAGTVALWCAMGWDVVYVMCTDGSKGSSDPEMTAQQLVEIRTRAQQNAGKVLGLRDVVFLGYEDAMLQPTLDVRRDIAREIRRHRPDVLICQSPVRNLTGDGYIGHPDHFAAGEAAMSAVYPTARDRLTNPELLEEGLEPHNVRELWVNDHANPDLYVDVSQHIHTAVQAIKQHESQVGDEEVEKHMRSWRTRTGEKVGLHYAESFKRFRF